MPVGGTVWLFCLRRTNESVSGGGWLNILGSVAPNNVPDLGVLVTGVPDTVEMRVDMS